MDTMALSEKASPLGLHCSPSVPVYPAVIVAGQIHKKDTEATDAATAAGVLSVHPHQCMTTPQGQRWGPCVAGSQL